MLQRGIVLDTTKILRYHVLCRNGRNPTSRTRDCASALNGQEAPGRGIMESSDEEGGQVIKRSLSASCAHQALYIHYLI